MGDGAATAVVADWGRDWLQLRDGDTGQAKKKAGLRQLFLCAAAPGKSCCTQKKLAQAGFFFRLSGIATAQLQPITTPISDHCGCGAIPRLCVTFDSVAGSEVTVQPGTR